MVPLNRILHNHKLARSKNGCAIQWWTVAPLISHTSVPYKWPLVHDIATQSPIICIWYRNNTHTYTHPFNGPFSGTAQVSQYQNVKPIWILLKQETVSGSGISKYASLHLVPDR